MKSYIDYPFNSFLSLSGVSYTNFVHDCEYMKIICVNCGLRNEYESDLRSNEHFLSNDENKAWKRNLGQYRPLL